MMSLAPSTADPPIRAGSAGLLQAIVATASRIRRRRLCHHTTRLPRRARRRLPLRHYHQQTLQRVLFTRPPRRMVMMMMGWLVVRPTVPRSNPPWVVLVLAVDMGRSMRVLSAVDAITTQLTTKIETNSSIMMPVQASASTRSAASLSR